MKLRNQRTRYPSSLSPQQRLLEALKTTRNMANDHVMGNIQRGLVDPINRMHLLAQNSIQNGGTTRTQAGQYMDEALGLVGAGTIKKIGGLLSPRQLSAVPPSKKRMSNAHEVGQANNEGLLSLPSPAAKKLENEIIRQYRDGPAHSINIRNNKSGIGKKQTAEELRAEGNAQRDLVDTDYQKSLDDGGYQGHHKAPSREGSNTIDNLSDIYPDDVYGAKGLQYYGAGLDGEQDALDAMIQARGNPDSLIDIFRAVPKGVDKINAGDWVTPSRAYAEQHGGSWVDDGSFDVISDRVRAGDLTANGDALTEWGYQPRPRQTEFEKGGLLGGTIK